MLPYEYHTAIKPPVPAWVKQSFVFFDIWTLWRSGLSVRVPRSQIKNFKWWLLKPVWHQMLYSCTRMATLGVKRVKWSYVLALLAEQSADWVVIGHWLACLSGTQILVCVTWSSSGLWNTVPVPSLAFLSVVKVSASWRSANISAICSNASTWMSLGEPLLSSIIISKLLFSQLGDTW